MIYVYTLYINEGVVLLKLQKTRRARNRGLNTEMSGNQSRIAARRISCLIIRTCSFLSMFGLFALTCLLCHTVILNIFSLIIIYFQTIYTCISVYTITLNEHTNNSIVVYLVMKHRKAGGFNCAHKHSFKGLLRSCSGKCSVYVS